MVSAGSRGGGSITGLLCPGRRIGRSQCGVCLDGRHPRDWGNTGVGVRVRVLGVGCIHMGIGGHVRSGNLRMLHGWGDSCGLGRRGIKGWRNSLGQGVDWGLETLIHGLMRHVWIHWRGLG